MHSSSLVAVLETRLGGAAPARALVLRAVAVAWACAALASGCRCGSAATSCDAGFVAMGKSCVPQVDDCALDAGVGSVTVGFQCAEQHRACEASGGAHCTSCLDGYEDFDGGLGCEVPVRCEELHCEDQNRACVASPNGHCGECLGGYLRDAGVEACRKPLTCAGLTCADGLNCLEPADGGDAVCSSSCGPNAIPSGKGVCVECPACDRTSLGEDGPWLAALTLENRCICRTWPGFFWEEGQFPGVKPCDEDGDGFVRESAKLALASASAAVSENARCLLRTVTSVTLENEQGQQWAVPVNPGLALYETDRNDDPDALSLAMVRGQLPLAYGANGRAVSAKEINSFTKFCVSTQADFNENGLADVAEWQANPTLTSVGATFKPFVPFSYFAELNRGWFEPDTAAGTTGRWHVEERSRLSNALAGDGIGFADIPDAGTHWRSCERFRDSAYALVTVGGPQQNFDFARFGATDAGWSGMNHPSQFKCIAITNSRADTDPPNVMTADALAAGGYTFNACELNGVAAGPPATAPAENPSSGSFSCTALPTAALTNGQVGWVTTAYRPYDVSGGYQRGCVNECAEFGRYRCPNFLADAPINPSTCQGQVEDYGKLQCACDPRFSGPHCDEGCPGDPADPTFALNDLFLDVSYASPDGGVHASQTGFWLCVKPVATAYSDSPLPFFADPTTSDGGYAVYGEIPLTRPTGEPACESDCELNTGYSIR